MLTIDESKNGVVVPWDEYNRLIKIAKDPIEAIKKANDIQDYYDRQCDTAYTEKTILEKEIRELKEYTKNMREEMGRLLKRGFWSRLFNNSPYK